MAKALSIARNIVFFYFICPFTLIAAACLFLLHSRICLFLFTILPLSFVYWAHPAFDLVFMSNIADTCWVSNYLLLIMLLVNNRWLRFALLHKTLWSYLETYLLHIIFLNAYWYHLDFYYAVLVLFFIYFFITIQYLLLFFLFNTLFFCIFLFILLCIYNNILF